MGKLDASLALLLTKDHHMIEFPTILLPNGVRAGSIVKIRCDQDVETEKQEAARFQKVQDEILETFGKNIPKAPVLKVKNTTQTSCILEWEPLDLGMATLKNLVLYKDGRKLGAIPQPLTNRTSKLSGLPIDKTFRFQLRLDTTAGVYHSQEVEVTTHKMTDLSGITICLGDMSPNDPFTDTDIEAALKNMGAHYPPQRLVQVDTTHFVCTRENKQNPEFVRAGEMNIPIIRPEWLKACERERRIVGVRDFYVKDCVLPDIFARNYWADKQEPEAPKVTGSLESKPQPEVPETKETEAETKTETEVPETKVAEAESKEAEEETETKSKETEAESKPVEQDPQVSVEAEPEIKPEVAEPDTKPDVVEPETKAEVAEPEPKEEPEKAGVEADVTDIAEAGASDNGVAPPTLNDVVGTDAPAPETGDVGTASETEKAGTAPETEDVGTAETEVPHTKVIDTTTANSAADVERVSEAAEPEKEEENEEKEEEKEGTPDTDDKKSKKKKKNKKKGKK